MPIKTKNEEKNTAENEATLQFRNNPEVQKRLNEYKSANEGDVVYYSRVVKEAPSRAVDMLMLKDMQKHESEMRLVVKQLPQAKEFYEQQPEHVKQRIDSALEKAHPYYKEKAFVGEVLREMNRKNRQLLTSPEKNGNRMSA